MKRTSALSILCLCASALTLTSCMSREQADERLANACGSAAEAFIEEGFEIKEVKDRIFRDHPDLGKGFREVRLFVMEGDGWFSQEKEYRCIFSESLGFSHDAVIYQLKLDSGTYGKDGDKILGTIEDHTKLGNAVSKGLNQQ